MNQTLPETFFEGVAELTEAETRAFEQGFDLGRNIPRDDYGNPLLKCEYDEDETLLRDDEGNFLYGLEETLPDSLLEGISKDASTYFLEGLDLGLECPMGTLPGEYSDDEIAQNTYDEK